MSRNARHILWSLHVSESETYTHFVVCLQSVLAHFKSDTPLYTLVGAKYKEGKLENALFFGLGFALVGWSVAQKALSMAREMDQDKDSNAQPKTKNRNRNKRLRYVQQLDMYTPYILGMRGSRLLELRVWAKQDLILIAYSVQRRSSLVRNTGF